MRYVVKPTHNGWGIYDKARKKYLSSDLSSQEAIKYTNNLNKQKGE